LKGIVCGERREIIGKFDIAAWSREGREFAIWNVEGRREQIGYKCEPFSLCLYQ
jgi:hypothetical protein